MTDHITPWKSVYQSARILGPETTFVLSNAGHLQSLSEPAGKSQGDIRVRSGEFGRRGNVRGQPRRSRSGSWWTHWSDWMSTRSGDKVEAAESLGNAEFPPIEPAPGSYVFNE